MFFAIFAVLRLSKKTNLYTIGDSRLSCQSNNNVKLLVKIASEHYEGRVFSRIPQTVQR